jgi:hypothetical protein
MTSKKVHLSNRFRLAIIQPLSSDLARQVQERFAILYSECDRPANPFLHAHLHDNILPGLALYQVLRESLPGEEALAELDRVFGLAAGQRARKMKWLGRFPLVYAILLFAIKPMMRSYPAQGWETEWLEVSGRAIRFNMHRCFYCDVLTRYGVPELTASFCRLDDLVYEQMSPFLKWQRSQTIGRGAAYCNFVFTRSNSK